MTATKENLGSNRVRLEIEVPAARFQQSIDKVYRKSRGEFTIPGFRKGKAPRAVIESHYGPGVFYNQAFDDLFPSVYSEAITQTEVVPVGRPENLTFKEVDGSKGILFSVEVYTVPEVKLGNYRGLKATRLHHAVSDKDVDEEIKALQRENSRWVESQEPAAPGDRVNIDFVGSIEGVPFDGGTAEQTDLDLGSGQFIPGFEDQLAGVQAGEARSITVTFPEEYPAKELAGREAVFDVQVNSVKRRELPAIDDDFAEDVSEFDTMDELRSSIRGRLQKSVDAQLENALETELLGAVLAGSEIDVPPVMIENEVNDRISRARQELMFRGMTLEDYLAANGLDLQSYGSALVPDAEDAIKLRLVMTELVRELGTQPSEEELETVYAKMASERGRDVAEFRQSLSQPQQEAIASREATTKMLEKLKELSDITDKEVDELEAKKTEEHGEQADAVQPEA